MPISVTWNGTTYSIPLAGELNWSSLSNFLVDLGQHAAVAEEAKQAVRVALTTPVTVSAATDYAIVVDLTSPGASVVNLPAGSQGALFCIVDGKGDAATNNITINPNGAETIKGSASLVLDKNRQTIVLGYDTGTTDWKLLEWAIPPGGVVASDLPIVPPSKGGTGVANNDASTLAISGNFATTVTVTGVTTVTLPTTGLIVNTSGAQVLTNKDLSDPTNDVSGATATDFFNGGTVTLPTGPETLVGRATTDALTNKDYDGGVASNTSRMTIPQDTLANLLLLTRKAGTILYATDKKNFYKDDGTTLSPVGTGTGTGGVNYNTNPSAADDLSGYVASGAGITVTRDTTAADLPRESLTPSAILITCVSGTTDYVRYRFQIGDADKAKQMFISWAQKSLSGYASGDLVLEMWSNSASNYGGTYTQLSVANPNLAQGDYVMGTTWDSTTADYYELRIRIASGTGALAICDFLIGPEIPVSVPAMSLYSVSTTFDIDGTVSAPVPGVGYTYKRIIHREGRYAQVRWEFTQPTGGGAGSGNYLLVLPPELNIDTALHAANGNVESAGGSGFFSGSAGYITILTPIDTQRFQITLVSPTTEALWSTTNENINSGAMSIGVDIVVPIAEWDDENFVDNTAVEYVYNYNTSTGGDTTSFASGIGGGRFPNTAGSESYRVEVSPIQPGDMIEFEMTDDGGTFWSSLASGMDGQVCTFQIQNGVSYGITFTIVDSTHIDVFFGQYRNGGATFGGVGSTWAGLAGNAPSRWRVVKSSNPIGVGHNLVSQTNSGLVQSAGQLQATNTDDDAQSDKVGYIVESFIASGSAVSIPNNTPTNITSVNIGEGDWLATAVVTLSGGAITGTGWLMGVSDSNSTIQDIGDKTVQTPTMPTSTFDCSQVVTKRFKVPNGGSANIYAVVQASYTVGSVTGYGRLTLEKRR